MEAPSRKPFRLLAIGLALVSALLLAIALEQWRWIKRREEVLWSRGEFKIRFTQTIGQMGGYYAFLRFLGYEMGTFLFEDLNVQFPDDGDVHLTKEQLEEVDRVKRLFPEAKVRGILVPTEQLRAITH